MAHTHTNRLIDETSPYLLQHAHNPVHWYPWGEEALAKAKAENKPILVSIGYSACHWCHVMERESFEDEPTAEIMNRYFINIKIDREERPDIDHIYMDAVQAMTGSGGWPLNVFLTPDGKPFYGGTYYPPRAAYNRPSWQDTLLGVHQAFNERRHEIDAQAENLTEHIMQSNSFGMQKLEESAIFNEQRIKQTTESLLKNADMEWGGFGKAPKFPQTQAIHFLLRNGDADGHKAALLSLDKMIQGGIYDQAGGGFARYSTDTEWLAPHFEKMLYDNALLISVISEAYQLTGKERYKEVIAETIGFLQREMLPAGKENTGFFAALDADSEGVEGKYYVWTKKEVEGLLGDIAPVFCSYYDITEQGNWHEGSHGGERVNILRVKTPVEQYAVANKLALAELEEMLKKGRGILLMERQKRIRPGTDDKVILGWNALTITACCKAFAATGNEAYRTIALENIDFIFNNMVAAKNEAETSKSGLLHHTWKDGIAKFPAFLDDYAYLIQALIQLQEINFDTNWLLKAVELTEYVTEHFSEQETGFFYYTPVSQDDIIVRKKEVYDGATPSGNSVMADNLWRLSILMDRPEWRQRAMDMVASLGNAITKYPSSFGTWACLLLEMIRGTNEIAVVGPEHRTLSAEILKQFIPHKILMAAPAGDLRFPVLSGKEAGERTGVFLCRNYTCLAPVFSTAGLMSLINSAQKTE